MYIWLIEQDCNNDYDTYSDAVVVADTEEAARLTHPSKYKEQWNGSEWIGDYGFKDQSWAPPHRVTVTMLGRADDPTPRVICASFHAG